MERTSFGGVTLEKVVRRTENIPVFNTVARCVKEAGANASVIYVPPAFGGRRDHGSRGRSYRRGCLHHRGHTHARHGEGQGISERQSHAADWPKLPGIISPRECKIGIMPVTFIVKEELELFRVRDFGRMKRGPLRRWAWAQSTAIRLGGDPIVGTSHVDALRLFQAG